MKTAIRIAIIAVATLALWYLVVVLARGVAEDTSSLDPGHGREHPAAQKELARLLVAPSLPSNGDSAF